MAAEVIYSDTRLLHYQWRNHKEWWFTLTKGELCRKCPLLSHDHVIPCTPIITMYQRWHLLMQGISMFNLSYIVLFYGYSLITWDRPKLQNLHQSAHIIPPISSRNCFYIVFCAPFSNELQWLNVRIAHYTSTPSKGRQGDTRLLHYQWIYNEEWC